MNKGDDELRQEKLLWALDDLERDLVEALPMVDPRWFGVPAPSAQATPLEIVSALHSQTSFWFGLVVAATPRDESGFAGTTFAVPTLTATGTSGVGAAPAPGMSPDPLGRSVAVLDDVGALRRRALQHRAPDDLIADRARLFADAAPGQVVGRRLPRSLTDVIGRMLIETAVACAWLDALLELDLRNSV